MKEKQAYTSIDWVTIFLFAGMMPVAGAMDKSGAGQLIANAVLGVMGADPSPYFATAVLFILSCVMTQFMSNTASCALLAPIGIAIAKGMGADPHAVLMALLHLVLSVHLLVRLQTHWYLALVNTNSWTMLKPVFH